MSVQSGFTQFPTAFAPKWVQRDILRAVPVKSLFEPLGQSPKTNDFNLGKSDFWEIVRTMIPLEFRDAEKLSAFATKVGLYGRVALQPVLFQPPGSDDERPTQANPLVNGGSQTGTSIIYDGASASTLVVAEGQIFNMGKYLFRASEDETSDGAGAGTIANFWPAMRVSPANNLVIDINTPFLHAIILTIPEVDIIKGTHTPPISLGFREEI